MVTQHVWLRQLALAASRHRSIAPSSVRSPLVPRRTFLQFPMPSPFSSSDNSSLQTFHAYRFLETSSSIIYGVISDITSYPEFLPFCTDARILRYADPPKYYGTRQPASASLQVGWKGISEEFLSDIYCIPGEVVEAVSGSGARSSLAPRQLERWGYGTNKRQGPENDIFKSMRTRWQLQSVSAAPPVKKSGTRVDLLIEIEWKNALYATMSQTATPKVAGHIMKAFEDRVKQVWKKPSSRSTE